MIMRNIRRQHRRIKTGTTIVCAAGFVIGLSACSNLTSTSINSASPAPTSETAAQVRIVIDKYGCEATPSQVSQGKVEFTMINSTDSIATLRIAAPKQGQWTITVADSANLRPNKTATQTVTLTPGPYAVLCRTEGGEDMTRITAV